MRRKRPSAAPSSTRRARSRAGVCRPRRRREAGRRRTATGTDRSALRRTAARESAPGAAAPVAAAIASSRSTPGIATARRGKRNTHCSSTTQTELSQPSPKNRAELASSSGNCSASSPRTSDSSTTTSASHSAIAARTCHRSRRSSRPLRSSARALAARHSRAHPPRLCGDLGPDRGDVDHRADGLHGRRARRRRRGARPRRSCRDRHRGQDARRGDARRRPLLRCVAHRPEGAPPDARDTCAPARDRTPAHHPRGSRRRYRAARRPRVAGSSRPRDHPRTDRRCARPGGGHVAAPTRTHPPEPQRRERA